MALALLAVYLGHSIGKGGFRMRFLLLAAAPLSFFLLDRLNERARFWLLLAAIFTFAFRISLPQKGSISELILMGLAVVQLVTLQPSKQPQAKQTTGVWQHIPYAVFAFAGLAAAVRNGDLDNWNIVCLTPWLLMFVTTRMVRTEDNAMAMIRSALIPILGHLFIMWVAGLTGSIEGASPNRWGGGSVTLGPIKFLTWSVTAGTLSTLGVPAATMLLLRDGESVLARFLYGLTLVLFFAVIVLTATRGASIAAVAGALLAAILSGAWFRSRTVVSVVVGVMVTVLLLTMLPSDALLRSFDPLLARWSTVMGRGLSSVDSFGSRMDTLRFAVENIWQSPLGYGFGYLWGRYRIDEAMMYSALLNGTGLMGFVGFVLIVGQLLRHFTARIALAGPQRDLAAIGLGTLTCGLVAGIVSESVVLDPVHSFVFWTILAAAYSGTRVPRRPTPNSRAEHQCESLSGNVL